MPRNLDARHAELAAKAVDGTITQAELREAQRMVDEAAKAAGYNVGPVWHQTNASFTEFRPSPRWGDVYFFLSDNRAAGKRTRTIKAMLAGRILTVSGNDFTDSQAVQQARNDGYDGVEIKHEDRSEYAVFSSSQIKFADPFTFDDDGYLIPLSERFRADSPDIRYNPPEFNDDFWRWFGDSKVVDANGDPLIVYRGQRRIPSPTRFATTLGRATASFTAIPELANVYAKTRDWFGAAADFEKGANVGAYYLSIQNPADLRAFGLQANLGEMLSSLFHVDLGQDRTEGQTFGQDDFVQVITGLASRANKTTFFFESDIWDTGDSWLLREADSPSVVVDDLSDHEGDEAVFTFYFDNIEVDVFALADSKNFTALLKRAGYDGIFHQDVGQLAVEFLERPPVEIPGIGEEPDYAFDTFRPFEQTQIKSATGNRGTWDRDDPDITHNPPDMYNPKWCGVRFYPPR